MSKSEHLRERLMILLNALYAQRYACDMAIESLTSAVRCLDAVIKSEKTKK